MRGYTHCLKVSNIGTNLLRRNTGQIHKHLIKRHLAGYIKQVVLICHNRNTRNLFSDHITVHNGNGSHLIVPSLCFLDLLNDLLRIFRFCHDHEFIAVITLGIVIKHKYLKDTMQCKRVNSICHSKIPKNQAGIISCNMCQIHDDHNRDHHDNIIFQDGNSFYKKTSSEKASVPVRHNTIKHAKQHHINTNGIIQLHADRLMDISKP